MELPPRTLVIKELQTIWSTSQQTNTIKTNQELHHPSQHRQSATKAETNMEYQMFHQKDLLADHLTKVKRGGNMKNTWLSSKKMRSRCSASCKIMETTGCIITTTSCWRKRSSYKRSSSIRGSSVDRIVP